MDTSTGWLNYDDLMVAVDKKSVDSVRYLVDKQVELRGNPFVRYSEPDTDIEPEDREIIQALLKHPHIDPSADDDCILLTSISIGDYDLVKQLLADPRVAVGDNRAIIQESLESSPEIMQLLLADPRVDPSRDDNEAIQHASYLRCIDTKIVQLLLADPRVDPSANDNAAIRKASYHKRTEVVQLLLADPRVDPSANDNSAIRKASHFGHTKIVRMLLAHPGGSIVPEQ